jgi:hypothetical protein
VLQSIGTAFVEVLPGDYFEFIVRQTSGSTKKVAADELTWFALEVVGWGLALDSGDAAAGLQRGPFLDRL